MSSAPLSPPSRKHEGLQLVLSVGDQVDPEQIGPVPSNAIIVKQAPQTGVAEAELGLYHPCGIEYRAGVSGSRLSRK